MKEVNMPNTGAKISKSIIFYDNLVKLKLI